MSGEQILRFDETCLKVGKSRSKLYEDIRQGKFVQPRQLGPRAIGFLASEVDDWIRSRPLADASLQHIGKVSRARCRKSSADTDTELPETA
jgi:prophage regulatory protein